MLHQLRRAGVAGLILILAGCASGTMAGQTSPIASLPPLEVPGGCAGTQVITRAAPPDWARSGFTAKPGRPRKVPWALGKPGDALAYLWARQLVAVPRTDGASNKILWVAATSPPDMIEGRPLGRSGPVLKVEGSPTNGNQVPTTVDVPTPGCWSFTVSWSGGRNSIINLDVLPAGATPPRTSPSA